MERERGGRVETRPIPRDLYGYDLDHVRNVRAKMELIRAKMLACESKPIRKHGRFFSSYANSFTGCGFVQWALHRGEAKEVWEAMRLGQQFMDVGVIHAVGAKDETQFRDSTAVYRFVRDTEGYRHELRPQMFRPFIEEYGWPRPLAILAVLRTRTSDKAAREGVA